MLGGGEERFGKQCVRRLVGHVVPVPQEGVLEFVHHRAAHLEVVDGAGETVVRQVDVVEVDASGEGERAVDDQDFTVIAEVELEFPLEHVGSREANEAQVGNVASMPEKKAQVRALAEPNASYSTRTCTPAWARSTRSATGRCCRH